MSEILAVFFPSIAALAAVSLIVIVTNTRKVVQFQLIAVAAASAAAFLRGHLTETADLLQAFKNLSEESRFAVSVLVIAVSYFGASLYLQGDNDSARDSTNILDMPALCDSVTSFDVPSSLPKDDKVLFDEAFHR